jgi:peptidoglycan/xylan/chitin deacetylase (PgdA/CDA1 family)
MDPRLVALAKRLIHTASAHPLGTVVGAALPAGGERLAALTFDDGPDPQWTPRLLEILERHGARGTFFLIGKAAARHPELVARLVAGGHALGNHTWDHPSLPLLRRRGRRAQIRWCGEALAPYLAAQPGPRLFRPPYGHQSLASQLDALTLGYTVVTWTIVAEDWRDDPAEALVERVRRRLRPGSIVLFHDTLATTDDPRYRDRSPTLQAVETLLAEPAGAAGSGYRWVTVPELLSAGRPLRWPWYRRADLAWLRRLV